MEEFIIDLQGFRIDNNRFIMKEVAILTRDDTKLLHMLIQPPCSWNDVSFSHRKQIRWLERYYHGLSWDDGHIPYYTAPNIIKNILSCECIIYLKGSEKRKLMEKLLKDNKMCTIVDLSENIDDFEEKPPSLRTRNEYTSNYSCFHHKKISRRRDFAACALNNVFTIHAWLTRKQDVLL